MPERRAEAVSAIARARGDLDRALARLEVLADDDRHRVTYSIHAINNYLMVVATTLQLLRTKLALKGESDVRRWLDSLKQATNLMMSTTRGVLTASADGVPPLVFEPASLSEIAKVVCDGYEDIARMKRVRIVWKAPMKRDEVLTDRVAAAAVLDNLLSNAVKYSRAGETVSIRTTMGPGEISCAVSDHGPGLSAADQAKLFQRGVRLSPTPTAGETSTGYGLSIANDLAKALGGKLTCASVLGEGSIFSFSLPLAVAGAPS